MTSHNLGPDTLLFDRLALDLDLDGESEHILQLGQDAFQRVRLLHRHNSARFIGIKHDQLEAIRSSCGAKTSSKNFPQIFPQYLLDCDSLLSSTLDKSPSDSGNEKTTLQ